MLYAVFLGVVVYAIYALQKYILKPHPRIISNEFKTIGVVKQIFVYPIDGGPAREVEQAYCGKSGLNGDSFDDRSYIAYSGKNRNAILGVENPELVTRDIKRILRTIVAPFRKSLLEEIEINYLDGPMTVTDEGDDVAKTAAEVLGNLGTEIRIGHCKSWNREDFNDNRTARPDGKFNEIVDNYSPYFASYTLVNQKSLNYLTQKTGANVPPSDFRANIVIEGSAFCEDKFYSVKIGKASFYDVQPCTHAPSAFIRQANIENSENLEPYRYLKQNRCRSVERPELGNFKCPIFGITMTLISQQQKSIIRVGDVVTATMIT